jgi:hypothetical protein
MRERPTMNREAIQCAAGVRFTLKLCLPTNTYSRGGGGISNGYRNVNGIPPYV